MFPFYCEEADKVEECAEYNRQKHALKLGGGWVVVVASSISVSAQGPFFGFLGFLAMPSLAMDYVQWGFNPAAAMAVLGVNSDLNHKI